MSAPDPTLPQATISHGQIARRYWWLIGVTMTLLATENLFSVLEPWLLGRVIDGLVEENYIPIGVYIAASAAAMLLGVARRYFDTRAYGRIFREMAGEIVTRDNAAGKPVSQVSARVAFVQEFASFFEEMVPAALFSVISLGGALVMLAILSPLLGVLTLCVALIVGAVFFFSRKRIAAYNVELNETTEAQVDVLNARDPSKAKAHFSSLVRWRIALSDLEARNFGSIFFLSAGMTALAAVIMVVFEDKTPGQVFAALTYVMQFSQSLIILPYTYQQYVRTEEIGTRLSG